MEFFLNPWYMAAGGALISSPIIIHLINRMRFKRIRWAAMEFLLKSQKRNRRRLIIEQLILLLLRILMVLLVALLVARWIYGGDSSSSGALHLVVLDDSLSMRDRWKNEQGEHSAWSTARAQIMGIAKEAAKANSTQEMKIILLSDPTHPIFAETVTDRSHEKIGALLDEKKPTFFHLSPLVGLRAGYSELRASPQGQKILHVVSDFRESDWSNGPDATDLKSELSKILGDKININLIDTPDPSRAKNRNLAPAHDNVAIVEFRPNSRVVAESVDVVFTATIANFGKSPKQDVTFEVFLDGQEVLQARKQIKTIQPEERLTEKFTMNFQRKKNGIEFAHVRAQLKMGDSPLEADDVRDVVVDVRKRVPILVVDGSGTEGLKDPQFDIGDWRTLISGLAAGKAYEPVRETVEALEKINLAEYPTVYLLDVPSLSKVAADRLQQYVENGGNIVYFLGPRTNVGFINEELHSARKGLFPVKLDTRKPDLLGLLLEDEIRKNRIGAWIKKNDGGEITTRRERELAKRMWIENWDPDDDKLSEEARERARAARVNPAKFVFRDEHHPFIAPENFGLAHPLAMPALDNLLIAHYFRPMAKGDWEVPENEVAEVVTMPQIRVSLDITTKKEYQDFMDRAVKESEALAANEPEFRKHADAVKIIAGTVKKALEDNSVPRLERELGYLLESPGDDKRPDMPKLWANGRMTTLKGKAVNLRDRVRFGDGLVFVRQYRRPEQKKDVKKPEDKDKEKEKAGDPEKSDAAAAPENRDNRCGYVVAVLTTAGAAGTVGAIDADKEPWNEWGSGPALWAFANFIRPMQSFLNTQGDTLNRVLTPDDKVDLVFDKTKYNTDVKVTFIPQERPPVAEGKPAVQPRARDLPSRRLIEKPDGLHLEFAGAQEPGFYDFELKPLKGAESETQSLAYNPDVEKEGVLERTPTEKLEQKKDERGTKGALNWIFPGGGDGPPPVPPREPDVSEKPWIYLLALLVLIAEQAMAVHLSFHLKGSEAGSTPAPASKAA